MKKDFLEKSSLAAVICIGPDLIKMRVCCLKNRKIVDLDVLELPINLGHEIFNNKKISFECIKSISKALRGYLNILKEYEITNYKVIAPAFFLEAENSDYVIDQLKIHYDIILEVLEDSQEKSLIFYEILSKLLKGKCNDKYKLAVYTSANSVGVTVFYKESVIFSQNVKIGSLKLYDLLGKIQDETNEFPTVLEEYLERIIGRINIPFEKLKIDELIISGSQVDFLKKFCQKEDSKNNEIDKVKFYDFYEKIKNMPYKSISEKYNMFLSSAELLFINFAIYKKILNFAPKANIFTSNVQLFDAVIPKLLISKEKSNYNNHLKESAIDCSKIISEHYYCDLKHRDETLNFSTLIFDKMEKFHKLGDKKILLEIAVILHEVGYYTNSKDPRKSTFDIIKNLEIYGLKREEINMIAIIAKYDELTVPNVYDKEFEKLSKKDKLIVSKLIAIFRIANALDKAKKQKIKSLKIKLLNEKILFTGETDENFYLEKWAFDKCSPFFEEVFGVKPQLVFKTLLF